MSIEMLTTAAQAAGFAMAPTEGVPVETKRLPADQLVRNADANRARPALAAPAGHGSDWWSFWKTA